MEKIDIDILPLDHIYTLKCKDISICDMKIENNNITEIINTYNKKYAPVESYIFGSIDINRLNSWLSSRAIPVERDGFENIINTLNIKTNKDYLIKNLALSLSDQYWIKPINTELEWNDVNFFENNYNVIELSDAVFGKDNSISLSNSSKGMDINTNQFLTPNASLGGMLKKIWLQKDNENYLIKGSNTIYNLEPINEVLASKIANILHLDCVDYSLIEIKGKRTQQLASICKDIVDEDELIVSAYSLILGFPEEKINDYNTYVQFLEDELNILNAKEQIEKMFMLDYIILNEDRHLNNFGVIRNSNTLEYSRVCPIYDTGKAMNTSINKEYWNFKDGEIRSFEGGMKDTNYLKDLIHTSVNKEMIDQLKDLKDWYKETLNKHKEILRIDDYIIDSLTNGYMERIDCFESMMNEKHLIK